MTEIGAQPAFWQSCFIDEIVQQTPSIKRLLPAVGEPVRSCRGPARRCPSDRADGYTAMRSYSIASSPASSPILELAIERLHDGEVSPFFHDIAATGDEIELRGPLGGHFPMAGACRRANPYWLGRAPAWCR